MLGTTLNTRSALRLLQRFVDRCGMASAVIVNRGATRGDALVVPPHRFDGSIHAILREMMP